jgi:hypothetical protein
MARFLRDHGKPNEVRDLLATFYIWFTEGFGTLDLKEAEAFRETWAVRRSLRIPMMALQEGGHVP